jgi:hypothetical protein
MTLDWIEVDNEEIKHSKLLGSTKNKSCSACKVDPTLAFDHAVLIKRYECKASACYMNDETCAVRYKTVTCSVAGTTQYFQLGEHLVNAEDVSPQFARGLPSFVKEVVRGVMENNPPEPIPNHR